MSFWCIQFFQKTMSIFALAYWGRKNFDRFLEELKKQKRHFEINWPLPGPSPIIWTLDSSSLTICVATELMIGPAIGILPTVALIVPKLRTAVYICFSKFCRWGKVIYPKYSKHWPYTVVYTIDCVCSKMLNHGLNSCFFFFYSAPCVEL